jgi:hypothetical protein
MRGSGESRPHEELVGAFAPPTLPTRSKAHRMPLQNRVTPFGEIIAHPARGTLMGNRGILHDAGQRLGPARWRHPHWIVCRLEFEGRRRRVMAPSTYTELFFLDEAVALAAGHRPCAECRRAAFDAFRNAWREALGDLASSRAPAIDRALHGTRVESRSRRQITFAAELDALPDGAFVTLADDPATAWLVLGDRLLPCAPEGYGPARARPSGREVRVLTPCLTVAVLAAGYRPELHPSALV